MLADEINVNKNSVKENAEYYLVLCEKNVWKWNATLKMLNPLMMSGQKTGAELDGH